MKSLPEEVHTEFEFSLFEVLSRDLLFLLDVLIDRVRTGRGRIAVTSPVEFLRCPTEDEGDTSSTFPGITLSGLKWSDGDHFPFGDEQGVKWSGIDHLLIIPRGGVATEIRSPTGDAQELTEWPVDAMNNEIRRALPDEGWKSLYIEGHDSFTAATAHHLAHIVLRLCSADWKKPKAIRRDILPALETLREMVETESRLTRASLRNPSDGSGPATVAIDGPTIRGVRLGGVEYEIRSPRTRELILRLWEAPDRSLSITEASDDRNDPMTTGAAKQRQKEFNKAVAGSGWKMTFRREIFRIDKNGE